MDKWICKYCKYVNPGLAHECHNCDGLQIESIKFSTSAHAATTDKTKEELAFDYAWPRYSDCHDECIIDKNGFNSTRNGYLAGYQAATERSQAEIAENNIIIIELTRRFWDLRLKIIKEANDTVWYSPYETAVDFIDSVLEKTKAAKDGGRE